MSVSPINSPTGEIVLIGRMASPFVRRTAILLDLVGLPFKQQPVAAIAEQEKLLKINPIGRVPALQIGGRTLVDSLAIALTLLDIYDSDGRLMPRSGWERADALRLLAIANGATERIVGSYYERTRRPEDKIWLDWITLCERQALSALDALEELVTSGTFTFETVTYPEVALVTSLTFARNAAPNVFTAERYPALDALRESREKQAVFQRHIDDT